MFMLCLKQSLWHNGLNCCDSLFPLDIWVHFAGTVMHFVPDCFYRWQDVRYLALLKSSNFDEMIEDTDLRTNGQH